MTIGAATLVVTACAVVFELCMWFQSIKSLLASAFSDKMSVTLAVNAAPGGGEMSETLLGEARCMKGTVQSAGGDGKVVKGLKIVGMHTHACTATPTDMKLIQTSGHTAPG